MIFTVVDPGYETLWWLVPVLLLFPLALALGMEETRDSVAPVIGGVLVGSALVVGLCTSLSYQARWNGAVEDGIATQGFENVDFNGSDRFTASLEGEYFSGILVDLGNDSYEILEISSK